MFQQMVGLLEYYRVPQVLWSVKDKLDRDLLAYFYIYKLRTLNLKNLVMFTFKSEQQRFKNGVIRTVVFLYPVIDIKFKIHRSLN